MEVTEKAAEAVSIAPHLLCAEDINTAAAVYDLAMEDKANCVKWAAYSYGAMLAYAAGYIAGVRAERRKRKEKAARRANAERLQ